MARTDLHIKVTVEDPAGLIAAVEECDTALMEMKRRVNALGQMVRRAIAIEISTSRDQEGNGAGEES